MDPTITLNDDPLRVLRAFRFTSRYGFQMSEKLINALRIINIQDIVRNKITKERVGIEVNTILHQDTVF